MITECIRRNAHLFAMVGRIAILSLIAGTVAAAEPKPAMPTASLTQAVHFTDTKHGT